MARCGRLCRGRAWQAADGRRASTSRGRECCECAGPTPATAKRATESACALPGRARWSKLTASTAGACRGARTHRDIQTHAERLGSRHGSGCSRTATPPAAAASAKSQNVAQRS
eukprot:2089959-Lingulodinium_polyedra.AAC.1